MRDPGLRNQVRTEIQVGALLVLAFVALTLGVIWISGARPGRPSMTIYALAPDAGAVGEGTRVSLLGVDVGSVEHVQLQEGDVLFTLDVSIRSRLPRDTRAEARTAGFLGMNVLALIPGTSSEPLEPGDTIRALTPPGLQELAGELGDEAKTVLERTGRMLNDTTVAGIREGSQAFAATMRELQTVIESESRSLERMIRSLSQLSARLDAATDSGRIERTAASIDTLTARLAGASADLDETSRSLASILGKIDRGEGSIGRMVNDPELYESLTATLENLQAASEEVALLTKDVRESPEKYLKGLKFSVF